MRPHCQIRPSANEALGRSLAAHVLAVFCSKRRPAILPRSPEVNVTFVPAIFRIKQSRIALYACDFTGLWKVLPRRCQPTFEDYSTATGGRVLSIFTMCMLLMHVVPCQRNTFVRLHSAVMSLLKRLPQTPHVLLGADRRQVRATAWDRRQVRATASPSRQAPRSIWARLPGRRLCCLLQEQRQRFVRREQRPRACFLHFRAHRRARVHHDVCRFYAGQRSAKPA